MKVSFKDFKFKLDKEKRKIKLGRGGYGDVFLGEYKGEEIAIKKSHFLEDKENNTGEWYNQDIIKFSEKEIRNLIELEHENIVKILGFCKRNEIYYILMEYSKMGSLGKLLEKHRKNEIFLSNEDIITIACDIASAISYVHSKEIIHRDVKVDNILIWRYNNRYRAKLIDFGSARNLSTVNLTKGAYTFFITAPEIIINLNKKSPVIPYSYKSDTYSFGVVLWCLLTKNSIDKRSAFTLMNEFKSCRSTDTCTINIVVEMMKLCCKEFPNSRIISVSAAKEILLILKKEQLQMKIKQLMKDYCLEMSNQKNIKKEIAIFLKIRSLKYLFQKDRVITTQDSLMVDLFFKNPVECTKNYSFIQSEKVKTWKKGMKKEFNFWFCTSKVLKFYLINSSYIILIENDYYYGVYYCIVFMSDKLPGKIFKMFEKKKTQSVKIDKYFNLVKKYLKNFFRKTLPGEINVCEINHFYSYFHEVFGYFKPHSFNWLPFHSMEKEKVEKYDVVGIINEGKLKISKLRINFALYLGTCKVNENKSYFFYLESKLRSQKCQVIEQIHDSLLNFSEKKSCKNSKVKSYGIIKVKKSYKLEEFEITTLIKKFESLKMGEKNEKLKKHDGGEITNFFNSGVFFSKQRARDIWDIWNAKDNNKLINENNYKNFFVDKTVSPEIKKIIENDYYF